MLLLVIAIVAVWLIFQRKLSNQAQELAALKLPVQRKLPIEPTRCDESVRVVGMKEVPLVRDNKGNAIARARTEQMSNTEQINAKQISEPIYEDIELFHANANRSSYDHLEFPKSPNAPQLKHYSSTFGANQQT